MKRLLIVASLAALAACSGNAPSDDAETGNLGDYEMLNEAVPEPLNTPAPPPPENVAAAEPEPVADPLAEQEQIQEDADATGMTARLPADEETAPATNAAE